MQETRQKLQHAGIPLILSKKKLDGAYHYDIKLSTQLLPDSKNKVDVLKLSKGINDQKNRDPTTFDR